MAKVISRFSVLVISLSIFGFFFSNKVSAQSTSPQVTRAQQRTNTSISPSIAEPELLVVTETPTPTPRVDITKDTEETIGPLEKILNDQKLGNPILNPIKYGIRSAIAGGVPANTIVLLLMLPSVVALIAGARQLIGLRGFGIFLPAALAVVFLAIGPIIGIGLFLVIVTVSTATRIALRKTKVKLQYLPRMSMLMLFVVMGVLAVLFAAPLINRSDFSNVSIFPVLILVLLAEDFSKVQLGKSAKIAINLTTETLILALICFAFLNLLAVRQFALLHPEFYLFCVGLFDFFVGKYVGLRFVEYWRFRKLISN